jgi:hypothetical protein
MKITIQGQDYTVALDAARPLTIERKLNEPSICQLWLCLSANESLAAPTRYQSLTVKGEDGTSYFTGYIAVTPLPEYRGLGLEGPRYSTAIQAVSEELLLDQQPMSSGAAAAAGTAGTLLTSLVTQTGSASLTTGGLSLSTAVSKFSPEPGANWSKSAGQVAGMARASYRALDGALTLSLCNQQCIHSTKQTEA